MDREMNFRRDFEIHKAKNEKQIANFSMNIDDNIDMTCTILPSFHSLLWSQDKLSLPRGWRKAAAHQQTKVPT